MITSFLDLFEKEGELFCPSPKSRFVLGQDFWTTSKTLLAAWIKLKRQKSVIWIHPDPLLLSQVAEEIFSITGEEALEFPAWEFLPQEGQLPTGTTTGKRIQVLLACMQKQPQIILTTPEAFLQKTFSKKSIEDHELIFNKGENCSPHALEDLAKTMGFFRESLVVSKGTFAKRGAIFDIFPPHLASPFRLEFVGNEIESIRTFDPRSQRSIEEKTFLKLLPAQEQVLPHLVPLFDHLENWVLFFDGMEKVEDRLIDMEEVTSERFFVKIKEFLLSDRCLAMGFPHDDLSHFSTPLSGKKFLRKLEWMNLSQEVPCVECPFSKFPESFQDAYEKDIEPNPFYSALQEVFNQNYQVTLVSKSKHEQKKILSKLKQTQNCTHSITGQLLSSVIHIPNRLALISTNDLLRKPLFKRTSSSLTYSSPEDPISVFSPGEYVVHFSNGIGIYRGIERRSLASGHEGEFICLEYAGKSFLYVPIHQAHLITTYVNTRDKPPKLDLLGSNRWKRIRAQAEESVQVYAQDLVRLYAERQTYSCTPCPPDSEAVVTFEENVPFCPTTDQIKVIKEVKNDLCSNRIMDRLICGDVGFGKTEVAMRAAFKMVVDGKKQVAVLVPTTILALQQYETFQSRMEPFGLRLVHYSRLTKKNESSRFEQDIANGTVDIVIGTHRLLGKNLRFHNLGLIIVDEEQRFGVKAKEHLKLYSQNAHCLTLSATPIPRTFYMSLIGARELSIISTPPQERLPIHTCVMEKSDPCIKNAIKREFARGGGVYAIHNRIETLYAFANYLRNLVPQAKIGITHGKMPPENIEDVFHSFKKGEINLLISTTIIENGIDIPHANTIIIDQAHTFGLANLYQLKGRVGRWDKKAFAYFLIPPESQLTDESRHRIEALQMACKQGGGMKIAMQDLEIRGCGNILGTEQSGHVSTIGFHLYCRLLKKAIASAKGEQEVMVKDPNEVIIALETIDCEPGIPEEYIPELDLRLHFSHRIGECQSLDELDQLERDLIDRFGGPVLPKRLQWLFVVTKIKLLAATKNITAIRIAKIKGDPGHVLLKIERSYHELHKQLQQRISAPTEPEEYMQLVSHVL
ncbi:transcription-repair coupling factor [Candidatus Similichlamydia laticola]|uniref:Transcription-repair-coupling factor n=1 Tax=Candidatus Similichlamydia laticola TaxID=2170265 RepID=A0A369KHV0_9BACT|nr:transcription-repair coupling factor [Candidatus Similichlamydia laticola]RDB31344.1 Transcription-repair coupling factor [Candidatus Similichlamydia laticola]